MIHALFVLWFLSIISISCSGESPRNAGLEDTPGVTASDTDANSDGDTDGYSDDDSVFDGNSDSYSHSDTDTDADGDAGVDSGLQADREVRLVIEENADGFCSVDGTVDADNSGFSGSGYVNTDNELGAAVQWSVAAARDTTISLQWNFSNEGTSARSGLLVVNGITVATVDFPVTANWSSWSTAQQPKVELAVGNNSIRLQAITSDGLANIDSLTAIGFSISVGSCAEADSDTDTDADAGTNSDSDSGGETLAFPGAEGFGRYSSGGRGGEVYHVTNLNDSGAGSFRDAVSQPNRIVVFDVGGVIDVSERIVINRNIYVAGQTAPGGGITIYGNGIALNGDSGNDIIRYIRIRMGKNGDSEKDAVSISEGQDYMFDHVSISWGRDGTLDVNGTGIDNLSFQECIIAQGINNSNHSTGGLMQSGTWSVIRSLYIDNKTRNPKARGSHEFINNVLYNWATDGYIMGDTSGVSECNLIGNYFIYGPSSSSNTHITNTTPTFYLYAEDNWVDSNKNGVLDGSLMTDYKTATVMDTPFDYPGVIERLSAQAALDHVIDHVGASLVRDDVDNLLINQILSYGTEGQIINTEDDNGILGNVGTPANGTPPADSDGDGMPDAWESARGLHPGSADDTGDDDHDGYTNIEEYLSCIVGDGNISCP
ncbi:MAG: hypothetical protein JXA30_06635 [Deltaproteobacteria bacterium]|nr:hypothetical protein [Deltaproteobacteria bacterium]